jgi:hypothetical protein
MFNNFPPPEMFTDSKSVSESDGNLISKDDQLQLRIEDEDIPPPANSEMTGNILGTLRDFVIALVSMFCG